MLEYDVSYKSLTVNIWFYLTWLKSSDWLIAWKKGVIILQEIPTLNLEWNNDCPD